jgi:hypothetical protein
MDPEMQSDDSITAPAPVVDDAVLEQLGAALLWRVGRVDDGPVTVRVGFATSAALFADLPRLRSAHDEEIEEAVRDGSVRVEWVGPRAR